MTDPRSQLQHLPQVDKLTHDLEARDAFRDLPRALLTRAAREVTAEIRAAVLSGAEGTVAAGEDLAARVFERATALIRPNQTRVVNATGVILHTNLGRAVLPAEVVDRVAEMMKGYSLLEMDRTSGKRTKRDLLVSELLSEITGAEAATVVNNNAAATHIILHTLAAGREVICSHAHLVGIGGSFRLPDCMRQADVTLHTVGATNHCVASDYEGGIGPDTGMIFLVHTSNYQVVGFTKFASPEELIALGKKHGVPVVYDLGSGALVDVSSYGYKGHRVRDLVDLGFDLVCFSGDKLLGGPQAGIIVGRADAVNAIRKSPYYRMMRPDKVTLALLEQTIRLYREPDRVDTSVPVLHMVKQTADDLRPRAEALAARLRAADFPAEILTFDGFSEVGGGSLSNQTMATACVSIRPTRQAAEKVAHLMRRGEPAVVTRISDNRIVLDVRTLLPGEDDLVLEACRRAL